MIGRRVYIDRSYCVSASGASVDDVFADYESGKRPLREVKIAGDPDFGVVKVGAIDQEVLGLDEPLETCPSSLRIRAGLEKLLGQIAEDFSGQEFDALVIGRGRLKSINPTALEREINHLNTCENLKAWILLRLRSLGLSLKNQEAVFFIDGTCSSGLQALNIAWKRVRRRDWSRALVMGFDPFSFNGYSGLNTLGVLSASPIHESPKVFHKGRDGFIKAECYAATVLCGQENLSKNLNIENLKSIVASTVTNDSSSLAAIHPDGRGLKESIESTLRIAGIGVEKLSFIKAHGTGTQLNDRIESRVIREVLGDLADTVPVISYKSQFGHTTNASGLFELPLMIHCLERGHLKGVPLSQPVDEDCAVFVPGQEFKLSNRRFALSLSLGFGGINSSLLLERGAANE